MELLNGAINTNTIIVGDFNLDYLKFYDDEYAYAPLCENWDSVITAKSLIQQVNFKTWSRVVNNVLRSSTIDHVYSKDPTKILNLNNFQPPFGDHLGICFQVSFTKTTPPSFFKRDWRFYNVNVLCNELLKVEWPKNVLKVQDFWNHFESNVLQIIDELIPYRQFENNFVKCTPPPSIKNIINKRNRLLKKLKLAPTSELNARIKNLNAEIRTFFHGIKKKRVRRGIIPGNSKSLWDAVKIAKDAGFDPLPNEMKFNNVTVTGVNICEQFASFFENKVKTITDEAIIDDEIYNGTSRMVARDQMFMTRPEIYECIKTIKIKNNEGYDRIPQRVLVDAIDFE